MQHIDPVTLAATLREAVPMNLLKNAGAVERVAAHWCERHRYWHGPAHLTSMLWQIRGRATGQERDILALAALYHDAVYDPRARDNEEASADLLRSEAADVRDKIVQEAAKLIAVSNWSEPVEAKLEKVFFELDTFQLSSACPLQERLAYELAIFREFQWVDVTTYRHKRT